MSTPAPAPPTAALGGANETVASLPVGANLPTPEVKFDLSPVPTGNPIVRTCGVCIIGDEVLNGKTKDTNSQFLAELFFSLGITVKRIEVIPDDEEAIIEAVRRMAKNYDIVITSGGIGPTHDDITYSSIAKAFDKELVYDDETIHRMSSMNTRNRGPQTEEQKTARLRMALFPVESEVIFCTSDLWVPIVKVAGKVHIFPGVPRLFQALLTGLAGRYIPLPPSSEIPYRILVHTALPESHIAPYLTKLQARVQGEGITIGSYPKWNSGVDVSAIGRDAARLKEVSDEIIVELLGKLVLEGKLGQEKEVVAAKI